MNDSSSCAVNRSGAGPALFLLSVSIFLLTSGGHIYVRDEGAMLFMSRSLIDHGWFDVPINPNTGGGKIGPDGRYYMPFGVLQPLLATPFVQLGRLMMSWADAQYIDNMTAPWFSALATAWLCVLFHRFLLRLGVARRPAFFAALSLGFSTPFWVYAQTFFAEPLTALSILASAEAIFRYGETRSILFILHAGIWMMIVLIVRPIAGTALPALFLYLLLVEKRSADHHEAPQSVRPILVFSTLCCAAVALLLGYNQIRFGGWIETGYEYLPDGRLRSFTLDPLQGLRILFFSPGKSIFIFAPIAASAIAGMVMLARSRRTRAEAVLTALMPAMFISVLCRWAEVEGGVCWGPRLFLPALPVMLLAIAPLLSLKKRTVSIVLISLGIAGFAIQSLGVTINFSTYIASHISEYFNSQSGYYRFEFNPLPGHISELKKLILSPGLMSQLPPQIAAAHRSMSQINYAEGLNVWWLLSYQNRLNPSFILTLAGIQLAMLSTGIILTVRVLTRRPDHGNGR